MAFIRASFWVGDSVTGSYLRHQGPRGKLSRKNDGSISNRISTGKKRYSMWYRLGPDSDDSYTLWDHPEKMMPPILTGLVLATTVPHFGPILDPNMTTVTQFACPIFAIL